MKTNTLLCNNDGKPLTGHQTRWCSDACRNDGFTKAHREARNRQARESKARRRANEPTPLKPLAQRVVDLEVENYQLRARLRREDIS